MIEVLIGVQARSTSKRLPGKSLELIDDVIMVEHVINAAKFVASYFNHRKHQFNVSVTAVLLIPYGDQLKEALSGNIIVEGQEDDVLSRYMTAIHKYSPDYVVRITGDCPLILPTLITKHIIAATENALDYCSNSYDELRTFVDGYDVEIVSRRLFRWIADNVSTAKDKEHVTTLAKRTPPPWARFGVVLGHIDLSHIKLSVDTKEELEDVRKNKDSLNSKISLAKEKKYLILRF